MHAGNCDSGGGVFSAETCKVRTAIGPAATKSSCMRRSRWCMLADNKAKPSDT